MPFGKKTYLIPYLHNRNRLSIYSLYYSSWKYLCTIVSFTETAFIIEILQGLRVSSSKLKTIFYKENVLTTRRPIYTEYSNQVIDAIIIDDTKSERRSGGRPSIKGVLGLNFMPFEEE